MTFFGIFSSRIKQEREDDEQVDRKPQIVDNGYYNDGGGY